MTQNAFSKDQLKKYKAINTNYTKESLTQEINVSGLISSSLESLFATLAYSLDFLDISEETQKITPYAEYNVSTSPYHKNESANIISVKLEQKDGQQFGRPMMRLIHKESADVIAKFLNSYGATHAITASGLFQRANKQELFEHIRTFMSRHAGSVQHAEPSTFYQAIEEYVIVSLVTGNYDVFDISSDDFTQQLIDSQDIEDESNEGDVASKDDNKDSDKRAHLRVIK